MESTVENELATGNEVSILEKKDDKEVKCNEASEEPLFDDDGTENTLCHSPDMFETSDDNCSVLNSLRTPVLCPSAHNSTPDCTVIPRVPLSLIPFLSNVNEAWSCDLETPQAKGKEQVQFKTVVNEVAGLRTSPENDTCLQQHTPPVDSALKNVDSEYVCTSPILNSRKVRRRPKRRILKLSTSVDLIQAPNVDDPADVNVLQECCLSINAEECINIQNNDNNDKAVLCNTNDDIVICPSDDYQDVNSVVLHNGDKDDKDVSVQNVQNSRDENDLEFNDNIVDVATNSSTQDFFANASFSSIDRICQNNADQGKKEIVDCAAINSTETSVKDVTSERSEFIKRDRISNETKSNEKNVKCIQLSIESNIVDHVADAPMKFSNNFSAHTVPRNLVERVKDIKRLQKFQRRTFKLKSVDIPVEDFTNELSALEKAATLPASRHIKFNVQSQSEFIPFSKFCLLESEKANLETTNRLGNDLSIDILNTSKRVNESETNVGQSLTSITESFKDSPKLQETDSTRVSSLLPNVLVYSDYEFKSTVDSDYIPEHLPQALVSTVKDSLNSSGTSEALTRNTSTSLSLDENNIFAEVNNDGVTDSEMWKLGEMALVIANDIEDFSEWEYKSNDTAQKVSQQMNIQANRTSPGDLKMMETENKKPVIVNCNKEISEQTPKMNYFEENTESAIKKNEKSTGADDLTNNMQCGFITASGKSISISDDKISAAKKIFEDIKGIDCENVKMLDTCNSQNVTRENHNINVKEQGDVKSIEMVKCDFSTASGKGISINMLDLHAAEKLYEQIDNNDYLEKENRSVNSSNLLKSNSWSMVNKRNKSASNNRTQFKRVFQDKKSIREENVNVCKSILSPIKNFDATMESNQNIHDTLSNLSKVEVQNAFTECRSKRKHKESNAGRERLPTLESLGGFVTARGKSITISDRALKKAKSIFQDDDLLQGSVLTKNPSVSEISIDQYSTKNKSNIRRSHTMPTSDEFDVFCGFSSEDLEISNSLATKMKLILSNQDILDFENIKIKSSNDLSKELSEKCNVFKESVSVCKSNTFKSITSKALSGFSTASGKKLGISNEALSKARLLFVDEKVPVINSCTEQISKGASVNLTKSSDHAYYDPTNISKEIVSKTLSSDKRENILSVETPEKSVLNIKSKYISETETRTPSFGFSTAAGQQIEISKKALTKAKTLLSSELADVQNIDYSIKSDDAATSTPTSIIRSNTFSSQFVPLLKRKVEAVNDNTPLGRYTSKFKRVRLSDEFQGRKLFSEDTDYSEEKSKTDDHRKRHCREALWSTSDCTFAEKNDRAMLPRCYLQTSIDNIESAVFDAPKYLDVDSSNEGISVKLCNDRKPLISDEVMASTVALLADESDSIDRGVYWSSELSCNSTVVEDRHTNTWPIILNENNDIKSEGSSSPILRRRNTFHFRKRTAKISLKDSGENDAEVMGKINRGDRTLNSYADKTKEICSKTVDQIATACDRDTSNYETQYTSAFKQPDCVPRKRDATITKPFSETDMMDTNIDDFINISQKRLAAALEQEKMICAKKQNKLKPIKGSLLTIREVYREARVSWRQLTGGAAPVPYSDLELTYRQIGAEILKITAATAASYKFRCTEFYGDDAVRNVHGLDVGDGARLILNENNLAGISEFTRSFMASPGVDPALVPNGWVENHYRWIVWKFASMDRMKFDSIDMPRMLTPDRVMKELKYRYDREIDRSQRPALRRILEKDDSACRRLILCVASITEQREDKDTEKSSKVLETSRWKVELTDGWYSIPAAIDVAMVNYVTNGKVQEGTKLVTCGAELMNCDQGCSPLEIPAGACLKIHTNSTRRVKWDAKLGYQPCTGPISTSLKAIDPNGGQIGKLIVTVARVYPILYCERTPDHQLIFRNARCEEKAAMAYERECQSKAEAIYSKVCADIEEPRQEYSDSSETDSVDMDSKVFYDEAGLSDSQREKLIDRHYARKKKLQQKVESKLRECLPPSRQVSPLLKIRVIDCDRNAIIKVWTENEEVLGILKEGNRISVCNLCASGKRAGELQLTAGRHALFNHKASNTVTYPHRTFTSPLNITAIGFNPPFGEFDTVGIISLVRTAPHGMKNLEAAYLAYPNPDASSSTFLTILFWQGIAAYGYSDIISVGTIISCSNLEWRRSTICGIPTAYCTDRTVFTRNPRQNHLRLPFEDLNRRIKDSVSYVAKCASEISLEVAKKPAVLRTPGQGTPNRSLPLSDISTPGSVPQISRLRTPLSRSSSAIAPAKSSIQRRLDKLYWYGEPPELSPIVVNNSSDRVLQDFRPLFHTPGKNLSIIDQNDTTLHSEK